MGGMALETTENMTVELKELKNNADPVFQGVDDLDLDKYDNILDLEESEYPQFTLAKNKARFLRMVSWYRGKEEWIDVAPSQWCE